MFFNLRFNFSYATFSLFTTMLRQMPFVPVCFSSSPQALSSAVYLKPFADILLQHTIKCHPPPQNQLRQQMLLNMFKFQSIFNDCFIYYIGI